jgi:membrane associated rhomboid family serine protease
MLPIKDHNPVSRPAIIVPMLIGLNVFVFLFLQPTLRTLGGSDRAAVIEQTQFTACRASIPYEVMHGETVLEAVRDGTLRSERATIIAAAQAGEVVFPRQDACPDKNVWGSILFSMFLHGGWLHIAGNMLFLWVFGNNIEDRLGRVKFLAFYLIAGGAATYAQSVLTPSSATPLVGASGAIAGVLGAYLLLYPHARITTLVIFFFITVWELPAVVVLGLWFLLQVFQQVGSVAGEAGGVAYMAHIGGFVAGMILLLIFRPRPQPRRAALPYDV